MSALNNVHNGIGHHYKWLSPQIPYLREWGAISESAPENSRQRRKTEAFHIDHLLVLVIVVYLVVYVALPSVR